MGIYVTIIFQVFSKMYDFSLMDDLIEMRTKLAEYKSEHQALDDVIQRATEGDAPVNLLHIQQLKKKKLWLKDMIQKLQSDLIDDIIA